MKGKTQQGKLMTKLNERILKWPTEKRAFTKIKPRKSGKHIGTKENDDKISPKMYLRKYGIPEEGLYFLSCEFSYTKDKVAAAEKHIQSNETKKRKKGKKACQFIELL